VAGSTADELKLADELALVRFTAHGKLDPRFGRDGKVVTSLGPPKRISAVGRAVAIQADGKAVVVGSRYGPLSGSSRFALVRYSNRGRLDASFGRGGKVVTDIGSASDAWGVAIQRDGKIVAAGRGFAGDHSEFALARYTPDGKLDPSFGVGGRVLTDFGSESYESYARAVAIQADGRLVAAGFSSEDFALARYTADGRLDPSFGDGGRVVTNFGFTHCPACEVSSEWATAVAVQKDGKIDAAGGSDIRGAVNQRNGASIRDFALARYNADGSLDAGFGDGGKVVTRFELDGNAIAEDVGLQADGRIVAVGGAADYFALARYGESGKLDPSFGDSGEVLTNFGRG
jgi:uncharacterized delta-60 repeat protein